MMRGQQRALARLHRRFFGGLGAEDFDAARAHGAQGIAAIRAFQA